MSGKKTERWIKENVEAIAIAVVMALVIRHFAIEAFKIPTESMAPTLLGDRNGKGTGDRILVYKVPYLLGEPSRWDVVVFKYPLNESKNYIKRLVGMGGETLTIDDGDVLIDGKVARKPAHVQEVLFFPFWPGEDGPGMRSDWEADADRWSRTGEGVWEVDSPDGDSLATFGRRVMDRRDFAAHGGENYVGDVRLTLEVTPTGSAGDVVLLRIVEHGRPHELRLAVGEGESTAVWPGGEAPLPGVRLEPGETVEVRFANVDDALRIEVDGEEFGFEFEPGAPLQEEEHGIQFGVERGRARFGAIRIERDEYYTDRRPSYRNVRIPEGHYFMLGDNSPSSNDSRGWEVRRYVMDDGTVWLEDTELNLDPEDRDDRPSAPASTHRVFMDHEGFWRVVKKSEIAERTKEPMPFVPRENLIGKAFFIFWPLDFLHDKFRLGFIR